MSTSTNSTAKVPAPLYTWYLIRSVRGVRPKLVANNGKPCLNETVNRANKLERSLARYHRALLAGRVATVRITDVQFRKRFPKYPANAGKPKTPKAPRS
jgi:hypothetical protein